MPAQSLSRFDRSKARRPASSRPPYFARLFVYGGALGLTAWGAHEMYGVVSVSGVTFLQWLLLILFTINFSWIALAFTSETARPVNAGKARRRACGSTTVR